MGAISDIRSTKTTVALRETLKGATEIKEIVLFHQRMPPFEPNEQVLLFIHRTPSFKRVQREKRIYIDYSWEPLLPITNKVIGPVDMLGEEKFPNIDAFLGKIRNHVEGLRRGDGGVTDL